MDRAFVVLLIAISTFLRLASVIYSFARGIVLALIFPFFLIAIYIAARKGKISSWRSEH